MLLNVTSCWPVLIVFCVGLGLADGCFWVVEGPIAYDICGPSGAAQEIGFLKGLMGISFAAGPPIAGNEIRIIRQYYLLYLFSNVNLSYEYWIFYFI